MPRQSRIPMGSPARHGRQVRRWEILSRDCGTLATEVNSGAVLFRVLGVTEILLVIDGRQLCGGRPGVRGARGWNQSR